MDIFFSFCWEISGGLSRGFRPANKAIVEYGIGSTRYCVNIRTTILLSSSTSVNRNSFIYAGSSKTILRLHSKARCRIRSRLQSRDSGEHGNCQPLLWAMKTGR
jgi:hypothetical protein